MSIGSMKRGLYPMTSGGSRTVSGSFTPTFVDPSTLDITFGYRVTAKVVTLWIESSTLLTDTSTIATFSCNLGDVPAAIRPTATRLAVCTVTDNGIAQLGRVVVSSAGAMNWALATVSGATTQFSVSGFTASGAKGLQSNFCFTYPL